MQKKVMIHGCVMKKLQETCLRKDGNEIDFDIVVFKIIIVILEDLKQIR